MTASSVPGGEKGWGDIQVTLQVAGFKKLRWFTRENLGMEPLDLPPTEFQTTGYWLAFSEQTIETLRAAGAGPTTRTITARLEPPAGAVRRRDGYRCQVCGAPEEQAPA